MIKKTILIFNLLILLEVGCMESNLGSKLYNTVNKNGSLEEVQSLIRQGADVNYLFNLFGFNSSKLAS